MTTDHNDLNPDNIQWSMQLHTLPLPGSANTDKVILPQATLEALLNQTPAKTLPSPLCFQLRNSQGEYTHVGVREFSAPDQTVLVPETVYNQLQLSEGDLVSVKFVVLPKATYLKIKPEDDADDTEHEAVGDWKVMLEAQLNSTHTALTQGDTLVITNPVQHSKSFRFVVEQVEPAEAVCIVDTDVELDMASTNKLDANTDDTPKTLAPGQSVSIKFEPQADTQVELAWDRKSALTLSLITEHVGVHAFVGVNEQASHQNFVWSTVQNNKHELTIDPSNPFLQDDESALWVVIRSEVDPAAVTVAATTDAAAVEDEDEEEEEQDATNKPCPNCRQPIPPQSYQLHTTFCARNNVVCEQCNRVFAQREGGIPKKHWHCLGHDANGDDSVSYSLHEQYLHTPTGCVCSEPFPNHIAMAQHRATACAHSLHICRFCHLKVPRQDQTNAADILEGLSGHESQCGNRTTDCDHCGKVVRLRNLASHMKYHDMHRRERTAPEICANENCCRLRTSSNNSLGLCSICFGPLYVSTNDPDGTKLLSRIERRYVIQLTTGCGRTSCMNQYCALGNPVQRGPIAQVVQLAKQRMKEPGYAFCVDELTTKRKLFVDFPQDADDSYAPEWRAAAIEACNGNEMEARQWLERNAKRLNE